MIEIRQARILILLVVSCAAVCSAHAADRLDIALFPYSKIDEIDLTVVRKLWDTKTLTLVQEFTQANSPNADFAYLGRLRIVDQKVQPASQAELADFWNRGSFLTLLISGLAGKQGHIVTLRTEIYLGNLSGSYGRSTVAVVSKIAVDEDDFASVKDSHIVPTLFALALQAKAEKKSPNIIAKFLNRARMIALDLGWDKDDNLEKRKFFEAIEKESKDLSVGK